MKGELKATASIEIHVASETVWDALVNPEKIKIYLFGTTTSCDWQVGSEIIFEGEYQGQHYRDKGKIKAIKPRELLQYSYWSGFSGLEDREENYSTVTFRLEKKSNSIHLQVQQQGFVNEKAAEHSSVSWKQVLEQIKKLCEEVGSIRQ